MKTLIGTACVVIILGGMYSFYSGYMETSCRKAAYIHSLGIAQSEAYYDCRKNGWAE